MCDAWVAHSDMTKDGNVIFGKNSDRPDGECQVLHRSISRSAEPTRRLQCSYVQVPDDQGALATLGCRPYWCFGYETGINEAGVVGGNTAIFTKSRHLAENRKQLGLTGMDLLRFGLERGSTAEEAVEAIIELLQQYGQWGSAVACKTHEQGSYENAFLLADCKESWILETSGRFWIAKRKEGGYQALSNQPTIRDRWTNTSTHLQDLATEMGWWQTENDAFDFARVFGDHDHYPCQVSHLRFRRVCSLLESSAGHLDVDTAMRVLRDHYQDTFIGGPQFHPFLPDFHTICMHDSPSGFTWGNTATSVIVELDPKGVREPRLNVAYQPPCTSVYLGFSFSEPLPELLTRTGKESLGVFDPTTVPNDDFDDASLWWRLHRIVQATGMRPDTRYPEIRQRFGDVEAQNKKLYFSEEAMQDADKNHAVEQQLERLMSEIEALERRWHL